MMMAHRRSYGFVDEALAKHCRSRRVAVTIANFMMALAVISETDLIAALPRQLVAMHAARRRGAHASAVAAAAFSNPRGRPEVAMMDAGLAWLFEAMRDTVHINRSCTCRPRPDSCS